MARRRTGKCVSIVQGRIRRPRVVGLKNTCKPGQHTQDTRSHHFFAGGLLGDPRNPLTMVAQAQAALTAPISHLAILTPRRVISGKLWASVSLSLGRKKTVPFLKRLFFFMDYVVETMKAVYRGRFRTDVAITEKKMDTLLCTGYELVPDKGVTFHLRAIKL